MSVARENQMREGLVAAYRRVVGLGLMHQATGNLSCRVDGGLLISCSGASAEAFGTEQVVMIGEDGSWDPGVNPSSEWRMHQSIYQRCDNAHVIVHTHSDYCVALACNNKPLPGFHYMVGTFGGHDVPCVPYATFGTETLADDAAAALTDRAACLLGNHGMICRGTDFDTAVANAERLERLCKQYWLACQLGEPDLLTDEQWDDFFNRAGDLGYIEAP